MLKKIVKSNKSVFAVFLFCKQVVNTTHDRNHADTLLESYVATVIPNILSVFFNSPFSETSTTIKVISLIFIAYFRAILTSRLGDHSVGLLSICVTHRYFIFLIVRRPVPIGLPVYEIDPKIQPTSFLKKSCFARCIKVQLHMAKIILY